MFGITRSKQVLCYYNQQKKKKKKKGIKNSCNKYMSNTSRFVTLEIYESRSFS